MKLLVLFLIYSFVSCKLLNRNIVFQSSPNGRIQLSPFSVVQVPLPMFRGGSTPENDVNNKRLRVPMTSVIITTSIGSEFLDKKKKISIPSNCTVVELKNIVASKFPGSPPTELQKLYFSSKLLADDEVVGDISSLSPVPILLDMISGTSTYNKTLTIRQAIDAYVSSVVQQTYLSEKLKLESLQADDDVSLNDDSIAEQSDNSVESGATNEEESEDESDNTENELEMETPLYRTMYERVNASIYSRYGDYIEAALENERDPEVSSEDTSAWRGAQQASRSQLTEKLAKEFDLNLRGLKSFGYYSVVLMSFAAVGSASTGSAVTLLAMIPALWLSKLRQLRLLAKIGVHLALPLAAQWDFLLPLLPAPYQAIALQDSKENSGSSDDSNVFPDISAEFDFSRTIKTALKPFRRNKWFKLLTKGTSFDKKKSRNTQKKVRRSKLKDSVSGFSVYSDVVPHPEEEEEIEPDPMEEYLEQSHIAKGDTLSAVFDDVVDKLSSGLSDMEEDARTIAESGMEIAVDDDEDNANEEQEEDTDESEELEEAEEHSESTAEEKQRHHDTEDSEEKEGEEEEEEEIADGDSADEDEADDYADSAEDGAEDDEVAVENQEATESADESDIQGNNTEEDADLAEADNEEDLEGEIVIDSSDETETEDDLDVEDKADDDADDFEGSSEPDGDHRDNDNDGEESAIDEDDAPAGDWGKTDGADADSVVADDDDEYDDSAEDDDDLLDDTIETEDAMAEQDEDEDVGDDDDDDDDFEPEEKSDEQDLKEVDEPDEDDNSLLADEVDEFDDLGDESELQEELPEEQEEQGDDSEIIDDNSEEDEEQEQEQEEDNESEEDSDDIDGDDDYGLYDEDDVDDEE